MARKKRDPMLGMSLRERTQYKAKQAQKKLAEAKAAKARQLKIDKEAEAARKAAPKNERARAQSEGGGMGKPKPTKPATKPTKPTKPTKTTKTTKTTKPKTKPNKSLSIPPSKKANKGSGKDGSFGTGTYGSGRPSDVKPVRNRRGRVVNNPTPVKAKPRKFQVKEAKKPVRKDYPTEAAFKAAMRRYLASDI